MFLMSNSTVCQYVKRVSSESCKLMFSFAKHKYFLSLNYDVYIQTKKFLSDIYFRCMWIIWQYCDIMNCEHFLRLFTETFTHLCLIFTTIAWLKLCFLLSVIYFLNIFICLFFFFFSNHWSLNDFTVSHNQQCQ